MLTRRTTLGALVSSPLLPAIAQATTRIDSKRWPVVQAAAHRQTVYWNAWAGEPRVNDYIAWAGREAARRFGVKVVHVKLSDTAEAVARVIAEKAAGTLSDGAVDLIWINGANFASMKRNGLLFGPWAEDLPNFALTDPAHHPEMRQDFTVPVDGYEAPWGRAQLVFFYDSATLPTPPLTVQALRLWARANPGRFTYPLPPDFLGTTFLKQALLDLVADRAPLYRPVGEAEFTVTTAPLWGFLDGLHPFLWRKGRIFPANSADLRRLVADRETSIGFSFDPASAQAAIAAGELPTSVRSFVLTGGTVGNVNFLAIPFNAAHREGAMVLANFLLSPEAQARKQDPTVMGGTTVLAVDKLPPAGRALFERIELGTATPRPQQLGQVIPEPHPSWMGRLATAWAQRYTGK
jgi:putative thiamine transport system substrate-binding protein